MAGQRQRAARRGTALRLEGTLPHRGGVKELSVPLWSLRAVSLPVAPAGAVVSPIVLAVSVAAPLCIEPDAFPLPVVPAVLSRLFPLQAAMRATQRKPTIHEVLFIRYTSGKALKADPPARPKSARKER